MFLTFQGGSKRLFYKGISQIFLSYHHRVFSITISSMGMIRKQSINREKCSCVEYVGFARGGGVLCDYCECTSVHHEKLTDPEFRGHINSI